jgi:leucine dehydrogenase
MTLTTMIEEWNGIGLVATYDRPTAAWIFIALHDDTMGVPLGGTRLKVYPAPTDGLRDACRLAEGMTYKWAAVNFPFGGGKAVLALSRPIDADERRALLTRYGELLGTLRGAFITGQDLGTTPDDLATIARAAPYVNGVDDLGHVEDPGPYTARAVFAGIRSAVEFRFGNADLTGRRIVIQGVGDVGRPLAERLARAGAQLVLSDVDAGRVQAVAAPLAADVVVPEAVYATPCDVFAPCAVGATINAETVPQLRCAIVAGSANNQLREDDDAERLVEREILYAPDYIINAGGAVGQGMKRLGEHDEETIGARLDQVGDTLLEIFREAADRSESPARTARRRVERILASRRRA